MQIIQKATTKSLSAMKIGGSVDTLIIIQSEKELEETLPEIHSPIIPIGHGTNSIFGPETLQSTILKIEIKGILNMHEDSDEVLVTAYAGEKWDDLVSWTVARGLYGIESLSCIPGTVGASPVQNIGAYGQEVSDTIVNVTAYDITMKRMLTMSNTDCQFAYRDSLFKRNPNRYIITKVSFRFSKHPKTNVLYKDLALFFLDKKIKQPNPEQIRHAVSIIRARKLPDYNIIPNCGSYFKNPIITKDRYTQLQDKYPDIIGHKIDDNHMKLYAGWMIEKAGFKGVSFGNIKVHNHNALVLISNGQATFKELMDAENQIKAKVHHMFDVELEREPNIFT